MRHFIVSRVILLSHCLPFLPIICAYCYLPSHKNSFIPRASAHVGVFFLELFFFRLNSFKHPASQSGCYLTVVSY